MKRCTLLFITASLIAGPITQRANAQAALLVLLFGDQVASESFYFSLKLGGNVANVTNVEDGSVRCGLNFGLLATIKLSDRFYLVPEFAPLSAKGISKYPTVTTGDPTVDGLLSLDKKSSFELNYLDIPIVLKYYPQKTVNVGLGPYFSYLTSANRKVEGTLTTTGAAVTLVDDIKSNLKSWDYGAVFEVGYAPWRTGPTDELNFHVRYVLGLANIQNVNGANTLKNSVFQFFVSIPFMNPPKEEKGPEK